MPEENKQETVVVSIIVTVEVANSDADQVRDGLWDMVNRAMNNGTITAETPGEIINWTADTKVHYHSFGDAEEFWNQLDPNTTEVES